MKAERTGRPESISAYITRFPRPVQAVLKQVRSTIQKAIPKAQEVISYSIPAYKQDGGYVIYFAGWKEHYSLYPANRRLVAAFKEELAPYEVNNKGTIRFPLDKPVPKKLITGIARFRAREVAERTGTKTAATSTASKRR
jgi:uncharacterized protein YdhG (YjbR/CyaY superfamily)